MDLILTKLFSRIAPRVYRESFFLLIILTVSLISIYPNLRQTLFNSPTDYILGMLIWLGMGISIVWFKEKLPSVLQEILVFAYSGMVLLINFVNIWWMLFRPIPEISTLGIIIWLIGVITLTLQSALLIFLIAAMETTSIYLDENFIGLPIKTLEIILEIIIAISLPILGKYLLNYPVYINVTFSFFALMLSENFIHAKAQEDL